MAERALLGRRRGGLLQRRPALLRPFARMGYSGRYHAASLAAVFIALAIGILIGIGLADDVVSSASEELEDEPALRSRTRPRTRPTSSSRSSIGTAASASRRCRRSSPAASPATGSALIELGDLPDDASPPMPSDAVEAAGGELSCVAVIDLPPDLDALLEQPAGPASHDPPRSRAARCARRRRSAGSSSATGRSSRPQAGALRDASPATSRGVDRVVFVRRDPTSSAPDAARGDDALRGRDRRRDRRARPSATVGVERTATDPTTLEPFIGAGHRDRRQRRSVRPGRSASVYALIGADGDFGVKEEAAQPAARLLPRPRRPPDAVTIAGPRRLGAAGGLRCCPPGPRTCGASGLVRENWRGAVARLPDRGAARSRSR